MKNINIIIWKNKTRARTDHLLINNFCILSRERNISANSIIPKWRLEHGSRSVAPQFAHFPHKVVCFCAFKYEFNDENNFSFCRPIWLSYYTDNICINIHFFLTLHLALKLQAVTALIPELI